MAVDYLRMVPRNHRRTRRDFQDFRGSPLASDSKWCRTQNQWGKNEKKWWNEKKQEKQQHNNNNNTHPRHEREVMFRFASKIRPPAASIICLWRRKRSLRHEVGVSFAAPSAFCGKQKDNRNEGVFAGLSKSSRDIPGVCNLIRNIEQNEASCPKASNGQQFPCPAFKLSNIVLEKF